MAKYNLIILYHRQPYREYIENGKLCYLRNEKPNGIIPLLKSFFLLRQDAIWIAASELTTLSGVQIRDRIKFFDCEGDCLLRRVPVSKDEVHEFYIRTSKEGFWPVLHSFPEKYMYESVNWENFVEINKRFAAAACEEGGDDSIIWIHDYNLWLAPFYIREKLPEARIAFFFHTPFPSPDIFNILHWRTQILESLLCCNMISFDIPRYSENFVNTVKGSFKIRIHSTVDVTDFITSNSALSEPSVTSAIEYEGNHIQIGVFPEGTNCAHINKVLLQDKTRKRIEELQAFKKERHLIFAPARVDYTKGLTQMLSSYERFLSKGNEYTEKVILFVVAVSPHAAISTYVSVENEIQSLVAKINDRFSTATWQPVVSSKESLPFDDMLAWFSASDTLWIPSLRDGMNIICKEFIAVKKNSPAALVLSEFAGAAVELPEAILMNPYSPQSIDDALRQALVTDDKEKSERISKMYAKVINSDISVWAKQLDALAISPQYS